MSSYIHPAQLLAPPEESPDIWKEMSPEAVKTLWDCAWTTAKMAKPDIPPAKMDIVDGGDNHITGTIDIDGYTDIFHIPKKLILVDGRRERVLLYEAMVDAILTWNGSPQTPANLVEDHILANSPVLLLTDTMSDELCKIDKKWHDRMRLEDEEQKKKWIGIGNFTMQISRIVQEKSNLMLPNMWRYAYFDDFEDPVPNNLWECTSRVCFSWGVEYATSRILMFALTFGVPTDVWKDYPVADMKRRASIIPTINAVDLRVLDFDPIKYLDDGAYKAALLLTIEAKIQKALSDGKWQENIPTEPNEENGPNLNRFTAFEIESAESETEEEPQQQTNDTSNMYY